MSSSSGAPRAAHDAVGESSRATITRVRVWDVSPGYLNRGSLLGEHREIHGLLVILEEGRSGYARHPETLRWRGHAGALRVRHELIAAEMALRGYRDRTPVRLARRDRKWPSVYVDSPGGQLALLAGKYRGREQGRIRLPRSCRELWAAHRYSVLARDQAVYRAMGRSVVGVRRRTALEPLALDLVELLRRAPSRVDLENALVHMWRHVRGRGSGDRAPASARALLAEIQRRVVSTGEPCLTGSTALSELAIWLPAVRGQGPQ